MKPSLYLQPGANDRRILSVNRLVLHGLILCVATVLMTASSSAHPHHVSIAEAEWNLKTRSLEVALKVHPNDLERALRELERLHERMEWDATSDANRERLETEIRIKAMNVRALERIKQRLESHTTSRDHQTEDEIIQEFHFDNDDGNVEIRIRKHH